MWASLGLDMISKLALHCRVPPAPVDVISGYSGVYGTKETVDVHTEPAREHLLRSYTALPGTVLQVTGTQTCLLKERLSLRRGV